MNDFLGYVFCEVAVLCEQFHVVLKLHYHVVFSRHGNKPSDIASYLPIVLYHAESIVLDTAVHHYYFHYLQQSLTSCITCKQSKISSDVSFPNPPLWHPARCLTKAPPLANFRPSSRCITLSNKPGTIFLKNIKLACVSLVLFWEQRSYYLWVFLWLLLWLLDSYFHYYELINYVDF